VRACVCVCVCVCCSAQQCVAVCGSVSQCVAVTIFDLLSHVDALIIIDFAAYRHERLVVLILVLRLDNFPVSQICTYVYMHM